VALVAAAVQEMELAAQETLRLQVHHKATTGEMEILILQHTLIAAAAAVRVPQEFQPHLPVVEMAEREQHLVFLAAASLTRVVAAVESIVVRKHVQLEALAVVEQVDKGQVHFPLLGLQIPAAAAAAMAAMVGPVAQQAALAL